MIYLDLIFLVIIDEEVVDKKKDIVYIRKEEPQAAALA